MKIAAAVIVCLLSINLANAQEQKKEKPTPEERAEKITNKMDEKLSLTEGQKAKILEINKQTAAQHAALKEEMRLMRERMKALKQQTAANIESVLTEEQLVTWNEMKGKHKEKREEMKAKHKEFHRSPEHSDD